VEATLLPKKETLLYVGMSEIQARVYKGVIEKDLDVILGKGGQSKRLNNIVMQLRKAANHPYLFDGVEDRSLDSFGEHLINASGKMVT
jgi:SWI/SNF-related matrix-associated actin-dependent regulator of chromatin subfamily A member 5